MFQFAHIEYLYGLLILPLLGIIFLIALRGRNKAIKEFGDVDLVKGLTPEASKIKPWLKFVIIG